jgi:hypothetical protein
MTTKKGTSRPYTTDYGLTKGHCETPRGAIRSAIRHLLESGRKHCVIEQKAGGPPIDVWYNGYWGVHVEPRKDRTNVVPLRRKA